MIILLTGVLVLGNSFAYAGITSVENKTQWRAQLFIANQIKGIGLVDSYQEDGSNISYVYDNCLAAIACMLMKNFGLAEEILDTLSFEVKNTMEKVPFESYDYTDSDAFGKGLAYCGNSAWLLQAMNIYQKLRASKRYYATQKKLADFLLTLQDPIDGGLRGDSVEYWKSTEHNIIAYVSLKNFGRLNRQFAYFIKAEKIKNFLKSPAVYNGVRFNRGANDPTEVTDVQALGALLLGKNYSSALSWADSHLKLTTLLNSQTVTGFDFDNNLDTIWLEGTLAMALAFYQLNNLIKADYYFNEVKKTIQMDGSVLLATKTGTASSFWQLEPWRAIAPTAWLIFYCLKFNPLTLYY